MEALGSAEALEPLILLLAMLCLIASDLSMLDPSSAQEHWMCLCQAVNATLKNAELDALDFGSDVANSHCYRGPSLSVFSHGSSPTLHSSSRATSTTPEGLGENGNDDDDGGMGMEVPVDLLGLDGDGRVAPDSYAAGGDLEGTSIDSLPSQGTKRNTHHPDAPHMSDGPPGNDAGAARLRGGAATMPWECKRNGNRKPLAREQFQAERYGGFPMIDGPDGPERDPDAEEEEFRENGEGVHGEDCMRDGAGLGGEESDEDEEAPPKQKRQPQVVNGKKAKGKGKEVQWKELVRKHRSTRKEAVNLMVSFSAMSSQRHQQNLALLISDICGPGVSSGPLLSFGISSMPSSSGLGVLAPMLTHMDGLIRQTRVLDFHRMVAFMQIALWLDWQV